VAVSVFDKLFASPGVAALERICFGDLFRIFQIRTGDENVRRFDIRLHHVFECIGVFGFREAIDALIEPEEMFFGHRAGSAGLQPGEAGLFRPYSEQVEIDRLLRVNSLLLGI